MCLWMRTSFIPPFLKKKKCCVYGRERSTRENYTVRGSPRARLFVGMEEREKREMTFPLVLSSPSLSLSPVFTSLPLIAIFCFNMYCVCVGLREGQIRRWKGGFVARQDVRIFVFTLVCEEQAFSSLGVTCVRKVLLGKRLTIHNTWYMTLCAPRDVWYTIQYITSHSKDIF